MITLIHGSDHISSRQTLVKLKAKYSPEAVVTLDNDLALSDLLAQAGSSSMFAEITLIVIEHWKTSPQLSAPEFLTHLEERPETTHLALWVGEKLRTNHKLLTKVTSLGGHVQLFEERASQQVFKWLDLLGQRRPQAYTMVERLLEEGEEAVGLVAMAAYHIRNLLAVLSHSSAAEALHPFVRKKTTAQAKNFTLEELLTAHDAVLETDLALKEGGADERLVLANLVDKFVGS